MEDERQEAQQTIMSNEGQLSRNFVEMRLDTRPLLKDIHEFLSAQRVILKTNADGEYYEDVVIEGKPLANNIGISRLMNLFLSLVNKDTVQGNLDKEEYYNLMVITRKELALTIKKIVGYTGELYFNDTKPDGTMIKLTNPSKLNEFGWKYKVELEDGIKTVYEWYLKNNKKGKKNNEK